jgi:hypothetical protein
MPSAKPKFELDLKNLQNNPLSHPHPNLLLSGGITPRPATQSSSSALLSLSQDITALLSLSIEAGASLVNDYVRAALGTIGAGELVRHHPVRRPGANDSGAGLAVVVVGAADGEYWRSTRYPHVIHAWFLAHSFASLIGTNPRSYRADAYTPTRKVWLHRFPPRPCISSV